MSLEVEAIGRSPGCCDMGRGRGGESGGAKAVGGGGTTGRSCFTGLGGRAEVGGIRKSGRLRGSVNAVDVEGGRKGSVGEDEVCWGGGGAEVGVRERFFVDVEVLPEED